MNIFQAIENRKSTRGYLGKAIEPEKVEALVKAASRAPQAGEFLISVILNQELIQSINDRALEAMKNSGNAFLMERAAIPGYQPLYGAPLLLVFSAPQSAPYGLASASCAAATACLAATGLELGSCYAITPTLALNADQALAARAGIPEGYAALCATLAGYAAPSAVPGVSQAPKITYCR